MGSRKAEKVVKLAPRYYDVEPLPVWMRAYDGYPDARPQLDEAKALLADVLNDCIDPDTRASIKKFLKKDFTKIWEKK